MRELVARRGPQRVMAVAAMVNSVGGGMFVTSSALYFTRVVGLSAGQVASGLFLGAAVGLLAGLAAGQLADRYGARETQIAVMLFGAAAIASCLAVHSLGVFLVVSTAIGATYAAGQTSKAPLIRTFGADDAATFRAALRSMMNLGWTLGALVAGLALQIDTPAAYRTLILARAAAFLLGGLVQLRLPRVAPVAVPAGADRWAALHDRRYLTAAVLNSLMRVHMGVPTFLLPLWVVTHTSAPRWLVAGLLMINTVLVVVLQVPLSRGVDTLGSAGSRLRRAGVALLVGLALMAAADRMPVLAAAGLLVAGMVVYTVGELWHSAAEMEWNYGLAPDHAQGQYSGVFGVGQGLAEAVGPAVLTICLDLALPGWLLVGAAFLVVGLVGPALVARAAPARHPEEAHV